MKILHLFSNWKWTGPAEPALNLAAAQRKAGHEVTMAPGDPGEQEAHFLKQIEERGVRLLRGMTLDKHINFLKNRRDIRFLADYLKSNPVDLIHTHLNNDHLIAGRARDRAKLKTPIVRSSYDFEGMEPGIRSRYLLKHHTDFLVLPCKTAGLRVASHFRFPLDKMSVIEPGVDTARFDAQRSVPDKREQFQIDRDALLVGIVARVQRKRRFDVFLDAIVKVKEKIPNFHAIIIGGGTHIEEVAKEPAKKMGLENTVHFSGIQRGDDYVGLLKALDLKVFLFPGSEGSCRAIREAMSMGLPVIGARRGMIPEIVEDGRSGLIIEDTAANLAAAILDLAKNPEKRRRFGRTGAELARKRFPLDRVSRAYEDIYQSLL